jgi:SpoVK/Ycf46/Vps4 family AAA+-type ATPase
MRKGADCLSKWVGESERQLRLLFDQVNLLCTRDYLLCLL